MLDEKAFFITINQVATLSLRTYGMAVKKLSETGLKMHRVWWIHLRVAISRLWLLLVGKVFIISLFVFRGNWKKQRIKSKLKTSSTIAER